MKTRIFVILLYVLFSCQWLHAQPYNKSSIKPDLLQALPFQKLKISTHQGLFYMTLNVPSVCINKMTTFEIVFQDRLYLTLQAPLECIQALSDFRVKDLQQTTLQLQTAPTVKIYKFLYHSDALLGYSEIEIPLDKPLEASTCQKCAQSTLTTSTTKDDFKKIKNVLAKEAFEQFQQGNLKPTKYFSILGQAILSDGFKYNSLVISDEYSQSYQKHTAHEKNKFDYKLFLEDKLGLQISLFNKPTSFVAQQNISLGLKKDLLEKDSEEFYSKYSTKINKNSFFEFTTQIEHNSILFDKKIDVRYNLIF